MSKRIATFCGRQINASGPLTPDDLAPSVLAAGLTRSSNPATSIRAALRQSPVMVQLPDGRFDHARRMLDGAALTHRVRFATKGRQVLYAGPELALLDQLLVHEGSLALSAGGAVSSSYGEFGGWCGPPGWLPEAAADTLLAFRLRNGRISVEPVPDEPSFSTPVTERLRSVLRRYLRSDDGLSQWQSQHTLGKLMLRALSEIPDLLMEPLPPLDEILQLGSERWGRDWPLESAEAARGGKQVVLEDLPATLVTALQREAYKLGLGLSELTTAVVRRHLPVRSALPSRHADGLVVGPG
ncbi:hypothetical protein [Kribbella sp. CA-293567]|uniref:hypothetical protein n=1 Tax=Kribbella sp. CA-293567 TaxID=3002436 RepID=UPI0022DCEFE2|nr:hypothetical protein [Kribbella sp. CA-293567]WBQ07869.1 hypothetical protein OX958_13960 [Kribbella sp. CA-293567]